MPRADISKSEDKAKDDRNSGADEEGKARKALLEELFYDFYRSRRQIYWMNFVRGLTFGLGSVIGGTVVVAVLIWALGAFVDIFPALAGFLNRLIDAMQQTGSKG